MNTQNLLTKKVNTDRIELALFCAMFLVTGVEIGLRHVQTAPAEWCKEHAICPSGSELLMCDGNLTIGGREYNNYHDYILEELR